MMSGVLSKVSSGVEWLLDVPSPLVQHMTEHAGISHTTARLLLGTVTITAAYIIKRLVFGSGPDRSNYPPGPKPLPLIGNMMELASDPRFVYSIHKLREKYGDIFSMYLGSLPIVVISSHELMREALIRQGAATSDRPYMSFMEIWSDNRQNVVWSNLCPRVQTTRKFTVQAIRKFMADGSLDRFIAGSFNAMDAALEKNPELDGEEMGYLITFHLIVAMCFGKEFTLEDPFLKELIDLQKEQEKSFQAVAILDMLPLIKYFPNKCNRLLKEQVKKAGEYVTQALEEHEKTYNPDKLTDFTYHLLSAIKEVENDPEEAGNLKLLSKKNFSMILSDFLLGATDTTRQTFNWIWHHLAAYPEVQKKAQEEIDAAAGKDGQITSAMKDQLQYLNAVIHEVIRVKSPAPLGTYHECREAIKLGGYDLPAGTVIWPNHWSVQYDPRYWDEPEEFRPERWIDEEGKFLYHQEGFVTFSMGKRSCIGELFAKNQLLIHTAMFLRKYTIEGSPGQKVSVELAMSMVMKPEEQPPLIAKRR